MSFRHSATKGEKFECRFLSSIWSLHDWFPHSPGWELQLWVIIIDRVVFERCSDLKTESCIAVLYRKIKLIFWHNWLATGQVFQGYGVSNQAIKIALKIKYHYLAHGIPVIQSNESILCLDFVLLKLSSHVNNQSWIYLQILILMCGLFWSQSKTSSWDVMN